MSEDTRYVIELSGVAVGLVVKEQNLFRFFSSEKTYAGLDRRLFRSPSHAERACRAAAIGLVVYERPQSADLPFMPLPRAPEDARAWAFAMVGG